MLGYAENELIGRNLHETLHPILPDGSLNPKESCTLCRARLGSESMRFSLKSFLHKNGSIVLVDGSIAPILEDGAATGSILAFHDVGAAYKTELWQRLIFDSAGETFFIWDENHKLRDCNAAAVKWLGVGSKEEALARIKELQPPLQEDGTPTARALARVFSLCDRKGMVHACWMFRHADGSPLPCEGVMVRLTSSWAGATSPRCTTCGKSAPMSDAAKRAPPLERRGRGRALGHADLYRRGQGAHAQPFGRAPDRLGRGGKLLGHLADYQGYLDLCAGAEQGLPAVNVPMAVRRLDAPDGPCRETLAGISTINYRGNPAQLIWLQDITELRAARLAAEASTRAKSDFLARMSHEIRTPMNAILGMTHLLLQTRVDERQRHYLESTRQAARNLLGLLNDILDFSKIEAGRMTMENAPFLLSEVLEILRTCSFSAPRRRALSCSSTWGRTCPTLWRATGCAFRRC